MPSEAGEIERMVAEASEARFERVVKDVVHRLELAAQTKIAGMLANGRGHVAAEAVIVEVCQRKLRNYGLVFPPAEDNRKKDVTLKEMAENAMRKMVEKAAASSWENGDAE